MLTVITRDKNGIDKNKAKKAICDSVETKEYLEVIHA
jgi:hypothetical protein